MSQDETRQLTEGLMIRVPDSVCEKLGLKEGDAIEIDVQGDTAILRKAGEYTKPVVKLHNRCSVIRG